MDKQATRSYSQEAQAIIEHISTSARESEDTFASIKKADLLALYSDRSIPVQQIADYYGVHLMTVYEALRAFGIPRSRSPNSGKHGKQKTISKYRQAKIRRLRREGMPVLDIAAKMGVSRTTVTAYTRDMVAKTPPAPRPVNPAVKRVQATTRPLPVQMIEPPSLWARIKSWFRG